MVSGNLAFEGRSAPTVASDVSPTPTRHTQATHDADTTVNLHIRETSRTSTANKAPNPPMHSHSSPLSVGGVRRVGHAARGSPYSPERTLCLGLPNTHPFELRDEAQGDGGFLCGSALGRSQHGRGGRHLLPTVLNLSRPCRTAVPFAGCLPVLGELSLRSQLAPRPALGRRRIPREPVGLRHGP